MESIETLVLVCDAGQRRALQDLTVGSRGLHAARRLVVEEMMELDPSAAVARARVDRGGIPLGVLARSQGGVLEALSNGADEAAVIEQPTPNALVSFLDRLDLRASMRRENELLTRSSAQSEKLAALGTLVAGVGHEINNPLSVLMLSLHAAKRTLVPLLNASWELSRMADGEEPIAPESLRSIAKAVRRRAGGLDSVSLLDEMVAASQSIADVIKDLRVFARVNDDEPPSVVDLPELLDQVLRLTGREVKRTAVVEQDYESDLPKLVLPRGRLVQVITNIVINAAQAMREVERPVHRLSIRARTDEEFVALCVSDTGPGIPSGSIERIFDPFFSTKREKFGTGLGLSISRSILRSVGGDLIVESVYGDGASFICLLPRPTAEKLREAVRSHAAATVSRVAPSTSVLVVDDDERVLRACSRFLAERCRIVVARDGQEAVDLLSSGSQVDVVVTELEMPEMGGRELHRWLVSHRPELARRTIIVTDVSGRDRIEAVMDDGALPIVPKPIEGRALLEMIDRVQ